MGAPVNHKRMRAPKTGTAAGRRHMAIVAQMPCLVCGGQATVHHVTASVHGGRIARDDLLTVPLCVFHHQIQHGPRQSVEALGHGGFYQEWGIDLLAEAQRIAQEQA